jgi:hypothetical protein
VYHFALYSQYIEYFSEFAPAAVDPASIALLPHSHLRPTAPPPPPHTYTPRFANVRALVFLLYTVNIEGNISEFVPCSDAGRLSKKKTLKCQCLSTFTVHGKKNLKCQYVYSTRPLTSYDFSEFPNVRVLVDLLYTATHYLPTVENFVPAFT